MRGIIIFIVQFIFCSALVNIELFDLGRAMQTGSVVAFGDFNSDRFVDLVIASENNSAIMVYFWNTDRNTFVPSQSSELPLSGHLFNVIAADFDYDGRLDVAVASSDGLFIHLQQDTVDQDLIWQSRLDFAKPSGPLLAFDADGDMLVDLFGSCEEYTACVWHNNMISNHSMNIGEWGIDGFPLVPFGSHAFVDLNGDCRAELVTVVCLVNITYATYLFIYFIIAIIIIFIINTFCCYCTM